MVSCHCGPALCQLFLIHAFDTIDRSLSLALVSILESFVECLSTSPPLPSLFLLLSGFFANLLDHPTLPSLRTHPSHA